MDVQRGASVKVDGLARELDAPDLIRVEIVTESLPGRRIGSGRVSPASRAGQFRLCRAASIRSSPYRLMRRGAMAVHVHFHSYPHGHESQEKIPGARLPDPAA